ncbi:MAG: D-alanyl-D-alanine carboxypeptidase [Gluconacetobacter diazotrophicus]|nr:D-alanyl-D-alanine carboxypeptidase [Gluconacetobacter diazotrophicus]
MPSRRFLVAAAAAVAATPRFGLLATPRAALARPRRGHHAAAATAANGDDEDGSKSGAPAAGGTPADTPIGPLDTPARWACITNVQTGAVLLQKAADERMPPSSLTKLMTAYITFRMLKDGRLHLDQQLPVSEKAWRMQGSKMFVPLGSSIAVSDLIRGMLIQSGNDACIVLAEGISGSEEQFVAVMNDTAARLGMTNSHFLNCTGWPADGHYMSARDIATVAKDIIADFPEYYHFFSEKDYKFNNINQGNRNVLVDKGLADGLKTGHTDAGGFGLCASSDRNGSRMILVVNGLPSSQARATEGERLLSWSFGNFENVHLLKPDVTLGEVPVWLGEARTVPAGAEKALTVTVPHGWQNKVKVALDYDAPVSAPVAAGRPIGKVTITGASVSDIQVPLVARESVARKSLPGRAVAVLSHALGGGGGG